VAVLSPLRDILSRDPLAAINGSGVGSGAAHTGIDLELARPLAGLACLGGATAIPLVAPDAAIPGMVLLVAALLLELPSALSATLALVGRLASTDVWVAPAGSRRPAADCATL